MVPIYVDHAATTPLHPSVIEAMSPYYEQQFGNPSSIHAFGRNARAALDESRRKMASYLGVDASTIVFTSGGTEADNMALFGAALANQHKGKHIITTKIEHHAILHTCQHLEKLGFEVTYLPVDQYGQISLDELEQALREDTTVVSVMYGNNEVGTLQPIEKIGELVKNSGALFHSDAVQAFGLEQINPSSLHLDFLSISGHKINGPKGIGCLYIAPKTPFSPLLYGGAQERNRRAGTENIAGVVGLATAAQISFQEREERRASYLKYRQRLLEIFGEGEITYKYNGHPTDFLPHILNVSFEGVRADTMLMNLDLQGIAASSGSACSAGSLQPSHVLLAMYGDEERANSAIRFSFGVTNSLEQIEQIGQTVVSLVKRLKR